MDCLFCSIINGDIDCAKVFEDENVLAFLDVHPDTKGHVLVVPKIHAENIFDINQEELKEVIVVAQGIAKKIGQQLKADGINLANNNGVAAGQMVPHFHLHIIPRYKEGQGIYNQNPTLAELKELAKIIQS